MDKKKTLFLLGVVSAFALAMLLIPFASESPDGLERVAEDKGFMNKEALLVPAPVPDYDFKGIRNKKISSVLAGAGGAVIAGFACFGLARMLRKR